MTSCSCRLSWSSPRLVRVRSGCPSPMRVTPVTSPATSQVPKEAVRFTWEGGLASAGCRVQGYAPYPPLASLLLPSLLWQPRCPSFIINAHPASPPSCFFSPGIPPDRKWPAGPVLEARRGNQNHRQLGIPPFLLPLSPHTAQNFSPIPPIEATAGHIVGHSPE